MDDLQDADRPYTFAIEGIVRRPHSSMSNNREACMLRVLYSLLCLFGGRADTEDETSEG